MCCLLQYTLYGKTIKGKTRDKRKTTHKTKNCTSCQSLSVTPAVSLPPCLPPVRLRLPSSRTKAPFCGSLSPRAPFHLGSLPFTLPTSLPYAFGFLPACRTPSAPFLPSACGSLLRLPSAAPLYCIDLMLCENIGLISKKVS